MAATTTHDERTVAARAEWAPAKSALLCEPNVETLFGLLAPESASVLRPFSLAGARREHVMLRDALQRNGVEVLDLREALMAGCEVDGRRLERLRERARACVDYEFEQNVPTSHRKAVLSRFADVLEASDPRTLANVLILRPIVKVGLGGQAESGARFATRFEVRPPPHLHFVRDPLMITAAGCVVGRPRQDVRADELELTNFALEQLGIEPLLHVIAPGTLEGGDFMPCGDFALQGLGLLTNMEAVSQCMDAGAYGDVEVGLVRDPRASVDQIHLDAYLCMLDRDLCAIAQDRTGVDQPMVDVYAPSGDGGYATVGRQPLLEFLEARGVQVVPCPPGPGQNLSANMLVIGPRHALVATVAGDDWHRRLTGAGVEVHALDVASLSSGYAGPRSLSQVLQRTD